MIKKLKKIVILLLVMMMTLPTQLIQVFATGIGDSPYLEKGDLGFYSVQYNSNGRWMYITYNIVHYTDENGVKRVAYCIDPDLDGIGWAAGSVDGYNVDLQEALSDIRLWRVYRNGYPYATPEQLGVETADDAYLATKQAGYWVLRGRTLEQLNGYFRAGQTEINGQNLADIQRRGEKVVRAIYNLVDKAYNGNQTPASSGIVSVNKVGEFLQDSNANYYSQKYTVSSQTTMQQYTVTSIAGFPEGSYIANINGRNQTTFTSGEQFKIMIPKTSITDNISGKVFVQSRCLTYPVYYGASRDSHYQSYAVTVDPYGDIGSSATLDIDAYKSSVKVVKIDNETKKSLEGVEFNFRYTDGQNIGNYKTAKDGTITVSKLRQGKVIATEVATREEYILNTEEQEIVLDYNDSKTITVENEHKRGNLKIYKVDSDNNKIALGGVRFALYSYEFDKITGYYTTDANGEIYIEALRTGKWALIEEETNKWYNLLDDQVEIKVEWNETTNTTIENELKKSQVKVIKVDEEDHEVKLENVEFEVLDKDGNVLETIKTNKEGEAVTSRYPVRDYEELYIKETVTNEKYVLDDTVHKIELKENEIVNQTFENRKIKGQIKVVKTSEEDSKITGAKAGDPMPNVPFDIYDENKNYVETIKTAEDGTAITSLLDKGIYFVKESEKDSPEWYLLNTNEYSAEIVNDGDIITVEITNIPENPDVDIEKDGIIQTTANQEIKYDFHIKNTGNTKLDNFVWTDVLPTDYVTATRLITGTYNQDLNYAVYYKTNKNDYRLLKDNLNTQVNNYISFTDIQLEEDEFVTEFKADFGTVDVGFESIETPQLFVNVKSTVKNDDVFTNKTRIEGYNKTYLVWDEDDHTTKVYEKKIEIKLPRTGC